MSLKTNTNIVKNRIRAFILDSFDIYITDMGEESTQIAYVASEIQRCAFFPNNIRKFGSYQACFKDHLQGLPSYMGNVIYNSDIVEAVNQWTENTTEYPQQKSIDLFYSLLYREFNALCKKHKISFPV